MFKILNSIFFYLILFFLLLPAKIAFAASVGSIPSLDNRDDDIIKPIEKTKPLIEIVGQVLDTFLLVVVVAALLANIAAGIKYITAGGEAAKVEKAKKELIYAFVGLILTSLTFYFVRLAIGLANDAIL